MTLGLTRSVPAVVAMTLVSHLSWLPQTPSTAAASAGLGAPVPEFTRTVLPAYLPPTADVGDRNVIVEVRVGKDGKVKTSRILQHVPELDRAVLDASRQWQFVPATSNGHGVDIVFAKMVVFSPDGKVTIVPDPAPPPRRVAGAINPKPIHKAFPAVLPSDMKTGGMVVMEAVVDRAGQVKSVRVLRSLSKRLDQAAVEALKEWIYEPTVIDGVALEVIVTVVTTFHPGG